MKSEKQCTNTVGPQYTRWQIFLLHQAQHNHARDKLHQFNEVSKFVSLLTYLQKHEKYQNVSDHAQVYYSLTIFRDCQV